MRLALDLRSGLALRSGLLHCWLANLLPLLGTRAALLLYARAFLTAWLGILKRFWTLAHVYALWLPRRCRRASLCLDPCARCRNLSPRRRVLSRTVRILSLDVAAVWLDGAHIRSGALRRANICLLRRTHRRSIVRTANRRFPGTIRPACQSIGP